MFNPWIDEAWRIAAVIAGAFLIGLILGYPTGMVLVAVAGYIGWHLRNLRILQRWLKEGKRFHPPESTGVWDDVFQEIYGLQQRNRKRKRKLGKMLNRFQEATEAMPDATVVLSPDNSIEWWNPSAEALLGFLYPRDLGQRISNLIRHPHFIDFLGAGSFDNTSIEIPAPTDDRLTISVRIVPYGKSQRLVVARDITRIERLEQMRRDFVANVSHELRTPLTVLSGYLETMDDDEDLDSEWRHTVDVMRQQTGRMQRIVEDLLMLSRLETERINENQEPISVPGMLAVICDDARRLSGEEGHVVRLEAESDLWLRGNDTELRSLFSNIVFNAIRYTPGGGDIRVEWFSDERGAVFAVTDNGVGIAGHHLSRLTERFYRVDVGRSRSRGGTGLGLAIVKHVLLRHGGRLEIDSQLDQGSTFRAILPAERIVRVHQQLAADEV